MRVLLSGGFKTQNIVKSIAQKFKASGDDFVVVEYIDNINEMFSRGDYFEKAVITEQSITQDYKIVDENTIRMRINKFAIESANRARKEHYVFLTQQENIANMIQEEILPIAHNSVVVLKEPPYYVTFFDKLIKTDINQLDKDIVYVPPAIMSEAPEIHEEVDIELEEEISGKQVKSNFDNELFGDTFDDLSGSTDFSNDYAEQNSLYESTQNQSNQQDFDSTEFGMTVGAEEDFSEEIDTFEDEPINDAVLIHDDQDDFNVSGEIPIYNNQNPANVTIPGFDDILDDEEPIQVEEDVIPTGPNPLDFDFDNNMYNTPMESTSEFEYNNAIPEAENNLDMMQHGANLFSDDDYSEEQSSDDAYEKTINDEIYGSNDQLGISGADYENTEQSDNTVEPIQNTPQPEINPAVVEGGKKRKISGLFGGLKSKPQAPAVVNKQKNEGKSVDEVKASLAPFAARGNSIVVTGCGGCGTSVIAYNLANIIARIGYSVLLVDMDVDGRAQSYISSENYNSMEPEGANLMAAVNSSNGINTHISVVRSGFHLLTLGLASDAAIIGDLLQKEKIPRFANLAKTSHNFVVYDVPFKYAVDYLSDITYIADNIALVVDASNWGITKAMLSVCNIEDEDVQEIMFSRAQLVFNKYRNLYKALGKKVKTCADITKVMDQKILELIGEDPGYYFSDLHIAGIINDDPNFEAGWFEDVQYSDTKIGQKIFLELLEHIILKK